MRACKPARRRVTNRSSAALAVFTLFVLAVSFSVVGLCASVGIVTTPVSPKLLTPGSPDSNGAEIQTSTPTLKWEQVFDAQHYSVYVKKFPFADNDFVFRAESLSKPSVVIPEGFLVDGERYRWYARAFNKAGWSDKSQTFNFVVSLPSNSSTPVLLAPGSSAKPVPVVATTSPAFRWKPLPNARRYALYISKSPFTRGSLVYRNESISDCSLTLPKGVLSTGVMYRWIVKSQNRTAWSNASQRFYFTVKASEEKTRSATSQVITPPDHKRIDSEPSLYSHLPSDVIVEGESPRWNSLAVGSFTPLSSSDESPLAKEILVTGASTASLLSKPPDTGPAPYPNQFRLAQAPALLPLPYEGRSPAPVFPPPQPAQPTPQPQPVAPQTIQQSPQGVPPTGVPQPIAIPSPAPPPPPSRPNGQLTTPSAGSMVQMQFDNIELRDLIKFVSNIMGKNFIFDDNVVKGRVTILSPKSLMRDEVFRVFESVLNYYGFSIVSSPEAFKVVKAADAKALAIENLDRDKLLNVAPEEKIATLIHPLEYLDSNTMVGILRPLMARDAYLVSVPSTNSLIMIDTSANLQRLKKLVVELDIPVSKQLSAIEVYNVQHTTAADLAKTLQALLAEGKKAATPKDKIFITSYAPTNSLLVSAPAEDMKDIKRIIEGIDTVRPQVLVEAAIVEVSVTKAGSLGVDWIAGSVSDNNRGAIGANLNLTGSPLVSVGGSIIGGGSASSTGSTGTAGPIQSALQALSGFNVGILGGNITFNGQTYPALGAFIKAIATEDHVNILSTPQILTMNNEEAEIVVGENRPYLTSSRLDSAGNPINTFDYRDVGIKLKVKPYINKDGLVYLTLYQEVTQVTEATVGTGNSTQPAPTTLKRSTKTTVGVKDAQTIVISGLIRDDSTKHGQGIPLLSAIPIIGWLFGSQSRTAEKTNLLVFITPRIIYSSERIEEISRQMQKEQEKLISKEKTAKQ